MYYNTAIFGPDTIYRLHFMGDILKSGVLLMFYDLIHLPLLCPSVVHVALGAQDPAGFQPLISGSRNSHLMAPGGTILGDVRLSHLGNRPG